MDKLSERMSEHYEIDGLTVTFTPWHSDYQAEDFVAINVTREGRVVYHAGMTHVVPSEEQAREVVETLAAIDEWLKDVKVVEQ